MSVLWLDIYGVSVLVEARDDDLVAFGAVDLLGDDFAFFRAKRTTDPCIAMQLSTRRCPAAPLRRPLFKANGGIVFGMGRQRSCFYGTYGAVIAENGGGRRRFEVFAANQADLHELAYLALLSSVGEALDLVGYHRVHALGIERGGRAGLVLLPSGGGKSAMAALLAREDGTRVYSDETPLVRDGIVYPFPVRIALRPHIAQALGLGDPERTFKRREYPEKALYAIPSEKVAKPARLGFLALGRVDEYAKEPWFERISAPGAWRGLAEGMVVGMGVAQMTEHMLRFDAAPSLARIAVLRLIGALRASRVLERYRFQLGLDARVNARALHEAPWW